ncbi:MAG: S8 family serine peptidase [Clostridiales bacterium]|nr:S8 family serine peptidase [Clostridiales bacterium]
MFNLMVDQIVDSGATVINCSFGLKKLDYNQKEIALLAKETFEKLEVLYPEVVIVAAAGNSSIALNGINNYPGGLPVDNLITVGAIDQQGKVASFTNTQGEGGEVTIAAYGNQVLVGSLNNGTEMMYNSGTSFSAPYVTGSIALIQSIQPGIEAAEIKKLLTDTSTDQVVRSDGSKQTISRLVSGKVIKSDLAVLEVINKNSKEKWIADDLLELTDLFMVAQVKNDGYHIKVMLPKLSELSVDLMLESESNRLIQGEEVSSNVLNEITEWVVDENKTEEQLIRVTRLDTQAYATVKLVEPLIIQSVTKDFPDTVSFNPAVVMSKEYLASLHSDTDPELIVENVFAWTDTLGDADQYTDNKEHYGWDYEDGLKTYYNSPDLELIIDYYGKEQLKTIKGRYTVEGVKSTFWIEFYEDGYLYRLNMTEYGNFFNGYVNIQMNQPQKILKFMQMENDIMVTELYDQNSSILRQVIREKLVGNRFILDGVQEYYHENGRLASYKETKDDMTHGLYEMYDDQGRLLRSSEYFGGKKNGLYKAYEKSYKDENKLYLERTIMYRDDLKTGETILYNEDGSMRLHLEYLDDVPNGFYEQYANGILWFTGQTENGAAVGDWTEYNEDGSVKGVGPVVIQRMNDSWAHYITAQPGFEYR